MTIWKEISREILFVAHMCRFRSNKTKLSLTEMYIDYVIENKLDIDTPFQISLEWAKSRSFLHIGNR